eukprot:Hpha_TRINITY_DN4486_c0_g1::TRINITY_DN4486_c0_g1_i2::g.50370::m.50370
MCISAGFYHSAAILADGRLFCWGANEHKQCNVPKMKGRPVQVAAGYHTTLALLENDQDQLLWAWGDLNGMKKPDGRVAQIVNGVHMLCRYETGRVVYLVRQPWGEFEDAVQVAHMDSHSISVRADGTVLCEGSNGSKQLNPPPITGRVVQVAAGGSHSLALLEDGSVVCWGDDSFRQCSAKPELGQVKQVSAGGNFSVALLADGGVVCWGVNDHGQCDVPQFECRPVQVCAGYSHGMALLIDGGIVCWGNEDDGRCAVPPELRPFDADAVEGPKRKRQDDPANMSE